MPEEEAVDKACVAPKVADEKPIDQERVTEGLWGSENLDEIHYDSSEEDDVSKAVGDSGGNGEPKWLTKTGLNCVVRRLTPLKMAREVRIVDTLLDTLLLRYDKDKIVGRAGSSIVTIDDAKRLKDDWMNDELMNFMIDWCRYATNAGGGTSKIHAFLSYSPSCWFQTTFFWQKLTFERKKKGYYYDNVSRWTTDVDLFKDYDMLLVPVNVTNLH